VLGLTAHRLLERRAHERFGAPAGGEVNQLTPEVEVARVHRFDNVPDDVVVARARRASRDQRQSSTETVFW
jgi:hypothetical protein